MLKNLVYIDLENCFSQHLKKTQNDSRQFDTVFHLKEWQPCFYPITHYVYKKFHSFWIFYFINLFNLYKIYSISTVEPSNARSDFAEFNQTPLLNQTTHPEPSAPPISTPSGFVPPMSEQEISVPPISNVEAPPPRYEDIYKTTKNWSKK